MSSDSVAGVEVIEIRGKNNDTFYETLRNAIEASRVLRINYSKKVIAIPTLDLLEDLYDLSDKSVYIKIKKRLYRKIIPPSVEWFVKSVLEDDSEASEEEFVIPRSIQREPISQVQECVS